MPSKKKKYNARFPAGRIKKIMQSDEEVGKVAQAVPVIISRTLELFVESLLTKTLRITNSRNAKTLSPSHMKQCIMSENQFDFLRELVKNVPDISVIEEYGNLNEGSMPVSPCLESSPPSIQPHTPITPIQQEPYDLSRPSTSCEFNFTKSLTISPPKLQQQHLGLNMSNGQASSLIRNGSNIINNLQKQQQQLEMGSISTTIASSSSLSSSQGVEISCKDSVIAKISVPPLTTDKNLIGNKTPEISSRNDLKRSWDSITRLRHLSQSPLKPTTASSSNTVTTSLTDLYSSCSNNSSISETTKEISSPSSIKISRLNSINSEKQLKDQQNITITPSKLSKLQTTTITNNSPTSITIRTKTVSKELEKLLTSNSDNNNKKQKSINITEPIVSIDENVCNKPIVNIDYSNLKLLQNDNNSSTKIENNNKLIKKTSTLTPEITNSPIINIDVSKIATQPPTINFNFNNLITSDNIMKNSKIQPTTTTTTTPTSATTLELDEDYDNI